MQSCDSLPFKDKTEKTLSQTTLAKSVLLLYLYNQMTIIFLHGCAYYVHKRALPVGFRTLHFINDYYCLLHMSACPCIGIFIATINRRNYLK